MIAKSILYAGCNGFSVGLGTFSSFGTDEQGFGLSGFVNYQDENMSLTAGGSGGWFNKEFGTGGSGLGGSLFGGGAFKYYDNESIGYMRTGFFTGSRDGNQTIGTLSYSTNGTSLTYSNDHFGWFGDGGDRFRTASLSISNSGFTVGTKLFTEDYGVLSEERDNLKVNGYYPLDKSNTSVYRAGILYMGYKGYQIGLNSDRIRDIVQNKFAHGIIMNGIPRLFGKSGNDLPVGYFPNVDIGTNLYLMQRIGLHNQTGY